MHGQDAQDPDPELRKSAGNPLGFGLEFRRGSTLVTLGGRTLPGGLRVERLELEVPEVSFPFDVSGGAEQFRHRRCRLRLLGVSIGQAELAPWLEAALAEGQQGVAELRLALDGGEGWLAGSLSAGAQAAPFTARFAAEGIDDLGLRVGFHDLRLFGPLPLPASALVGRLARALAGWRVEQPSAGWLVCHPVRDLLRRLLPMHGWKVPDLKGLRLDRVRLSRGRLEVWTARYPDELPGDVELEGERAARRAFLLFREGTELHATAEAALRDGRLAEARAGYLGPGQVEPGHPLAARRLLEIGQAEEQRAEAVEDLVRDRLTRQPEDVHTWLARAALLERRGALAEAGRSHERVAELCEALGQNRDAALARGRAGALLSGPDRPRAVENLERRLVLEPEHRPTLLGLAELYGLEGQWYRALRVLLRLARGEESPQAAAAHHARMGAIYLERLEDLEQARRHLDVALASDPGNLDALTAMAEVQQRRGQAERAARLLGEVLERLEPADDQAALERSLDTRLRLARLWEEALDDRAAALGHYTHVLRLRPDHLESLFRAGRLALELGQLDQADDLWSRLLEAEAAGQALTPDVLRATCLGLGRIHASRPDGAREARRHLARAVRQDPRDLEAWEALEAIDRQRQAWAELVEDLEALAVLRQAPPAAQAALREAALVCEHSLKDPGRAEGFYRRALEGVPGDQVALDGLTALLEKGRRYAELDALWQSTIRADMSSAEAATRWARVGELRIEHLGDLAGGLQALELAFRLDRGNRKVVERLLELYRKHGRRAELVELIGRIDPSAFEVAARVDLWLEQARLLAEQPGQAERAIAAYRRALEDDPELLEAHRALADLYAETEDWAQARVAIQRVLDLAGEGGLSGPGLTDLHRRLAAAEQALGDHEAAINHLKVVLGRFPEDEDAADRMAQLLRAEARWEELAELYAGRAARASGEQAAALHTAAASIWWEKLRRLEAAGDEFERAVQASPDSEAAPARLASLQRLAAEQGQWDRVAEVLRRRIARAPASEVAPLCMALASVLEAQLADPAAAAACWQQALEAEPSHLPALLRLAERRAQEERHAEAMALVRQALAAPEGALTAEQRGAVALVGARAAWALRRSTEATELYQAHLQAFAGRSCADVDPEAFERLELLLREARRFEELARLYQQWLQAGQLPERHAGVRRALALLLYEHLEQPGEGLAVLSEHVQAQPEDQLAVGDLARLLRQASRWANLAALWRGQWERAPQEAERLKRLEELAELLHLRLDDPDGAADCYRRLIALGHPPAWDRLAGLLRREGRHAELAELLAERAARESPAEAAPLWAELGHLARGPLQDRARALEAFGRAHAARPDREVRQAMLAVLAELGLDARRLQFLEAAATDEPDPEERRRLWLELAEGCLAGEPGREARARALGALRQALELEPEAETAARALALAERDGDEQAASELLGVLVDLAGDGEDSARQLMRLGRLYARREEGHTRAAAAFAEAARRAPAWLEPAEALVEALERGGDPAGAADGMQAVLERCPPEQRAEGLRRLATLRAQAGQPEAAIAALGQLVELAPGDLAGRVELERLLGLAGRHAELAASIESGLAQPGGAPEPGRWLQAAVGWWRADRPEQARAALDKALLQAPSGGEAIAWLERLAAEHPDWPAVWSRLASLAAEIHRPDREAEALRRLAEVVQAGERLQALRRVARLSWEGLNSSLGRAVGAWGGAVPTAVRPTVQRLRTDLERLLACAPDDPEGLDQLIALDRLEHRHESLAELLARRALSAENTVRLAALLRERAELLMVQLDREPEALPVLERLAGLLPAERGTWRALVRLYRGAERPSQAAGALQHLVALGGTAEEQARLWSELGELRLGQLGDERGAADAFREAARLAPAAPEPLHRLRELAVRLDDLPLLAEALESLANLGSRPAEQAEFHRSAGLLHWRLGQPQEARRNFERLLVLDAEDLTAHRFLARLLVETEPLQALHHLDWLERRAELLLPSDASRVKAELAHALEIRLAQDPADRAALERLEPLLIGRPPAERGAFYLRWAEGPAAGAERPALVAKAAAALEEGGDRAGAEEAWRRLFLAAPELDEAFQRLSEGLRARQAWEALLEVLERRRRVVTRTEERAELAFEVASLLERLGRPDEADEPYEACLELCPDHLPCLRALADLREREGRVEEAARLVERMLERAPVGERAALALRRAHMGERLGELEAQVRFYREALQAAPGDVSTRVSLVQALEEAGQHEQGCEALTSLAALEGPVAAQALQDLRESLRADRLRAHLLLLLAERGSTAASPELWLERADLLEHGGQLPEALVALQRALAVEGAHQPDSTLRLAGLQRRLGQAQEARRTLEDALGVWPDAPAILEALSSLLVELGQEERAVELLERLAAGAQGSEAVGWWLRLGELRQRLGTPELASAALERALQLDPAAEAAYAALESLWLAQPEDGARAAERAARLAALYQAWATGPAGGEARAHRLRQAAEQFSAAGQAGQAAEALRLSLRFDPSGTESHRLLAPLLRAQAAWEELAGLLGEWFVREPGQERRAALAYELGRLSAERLGDPGAAAAHLERCLQLAPEHAEALLLLGDLRFADERWQEAEAFYAQLGERAPEARRRDLDIRRGRIAERLGELGQAAERFARAAALGDADGSAHRSLVRVLAASGRAQEARDTIDRLLAGVADGEAVEAALSQLEQQVEAPEVRVHLLERMAERAAPGEQVGLWMQQAEILLRIERQAEAAARMQRALALPGEHRFELALRLAELQQEVLRDGAGAADSLAFALAHRPADTTDADWVGLLLHLADLQEGAGRWAGLAETLERLLPGVEAARRAGLAARLAAVRARLGLTAEAVAAAEQALADDPGLSACWSLLVELQRERLAPAELRELLLRWARSPGAGERRADLWLEIAELARAAGEPRAHLEALRGAVEAAPERLEAWRRLAAALAEQGPVDAWAQALQRCFELEPQPVERAELAFQLGRLVEERRADAAGAAEHYARCLDLDPEHPGALLALARHHLRLGGDEEAERLLVRLASQGEPRAEVLLLRAEVAERLQRPAEALEHLRRAAALSPDDRRTAQRLAASLAAAGREAEALAALERLVALHAGPDGTQALAAVWAELEGVAGPVAWRARVARELVRLGPAAGAEPAGRWLERADRLQAGGEPAAAAEALARAVEQEGAHRFAALRRLASLQREALGDAAAAARSLEQALALEPESQEVLLELAELALSTGQAAQAATWLERLLARAPRGERAAAALRLGDARLAQGRPDLAREAWERVLAEEPAREDVWRRLEALWEEDDPPEARAAFYRRWAQAATEPARQAELLKLSARDYALAGRLEDVLRDLEAARRAVPEDATTWAAMLPWLEKAGRHAEQAELLDCLAERQADAEARAQQLTASARVHLERLGDSEAGAKRLALALEAVPELGEALELLADLRWAEERYEEAGRLYARLGERVRAERLAEVTLRRGLIAARLGDAQEAALLLGQAVRHAPEAGPWAQQAAVGWIRALDRLARVEEAIAALDQTLLPRLEAGQAPALLHALVEQLSAPALRAHVLLRLAEADPGAGAQVWVARAELLDGLERPAEAAEALQHALALPGAHRHEVALRLASLRRALGDQAGAAASLEAALAERPEDHALRLEWVGLLEQLGRHAQVAEILPGLLEHSEAGARGGLLLRLAAAQRSLGQDAQAREALEQALALVPDSVEGHEHLAEALERAGDRRALVELLERWAAAPAGRGLEADLLRRAAGQRLALDELDAAARLAERAAELVPGALETFALLADIRRREQRWEDLLTVLGQWRARVQDDSTRARLACEMGQLAQEQLANPGAAAAHFTACLGFEPQNLAALAGLAAIRLDQRREVEAGELLARLAEAAQGAQRAGALLQQAGLLARQGELAGAAPLTEAAVAAAPGLAAAHRELVLLRARAGEPEAALAALQQLLGQAEPEEAALEALESLAGSLPAGTVRDRSLAELAGRAPERLAPASWALHAEGLERAGALAEAGAAWRRALAQDGAARLHAARRLAELARGALREPAAAIEALEIVRAEAPGDLGALEALAELYEQAAQWRQAEEVLASWLERAPESARASVALRLGDVRGRRQSRESSLAAYERALESDPGNLEAFTRMEVLLRDGSSAAELADFYLRWARGPAAGPRQAELFCRAAELLQDAWDEPGAVAALQEALRLEPQRREAHGRLAELLRKQQRYEELEAELAAWMAAETDPARQAELAFDRAVLAEAQPEKLGGTARAAELLRACLARTPEHLGALARLAELELAEGRLAEADGLLRRLGNRTPAERGGELALVRARVAEGLGRPEEALEAYRAALADQIEEPGAHRGLVRSLARLGRLEQARAALDAMLSTLADHVALEDWLEELQRELAPLDARVAAHLASLRGARAEARGELEGARRLYLAALELDASCGQALGALEGLADKGVAPGMDARARAALLWRQAEQEPVIPRRVERLVQAARALAAAGDEAGAGGAWWAALRLDGAQAEALAALPPLLRRLGRQEELLEALGLAREAAADDTARAALSFELGVVARGAPAKPGAERLAAAAALAAGGHGTIPGGGREAAAEHFEE
ncbi:MAG TPA: tetratricopeptide repeat protein, partial [Myxococcota bacterium]|nr:tetratricopeptide repeat protein [Myxococcota bacterium]